MNPSNVCCKMFVWGPSQLLCHDVHAVLAKRPYHRLWQLCCSFHDFRRECSISRIWGHGGMAVLRCICLHLDMRHTFTNKHCNKTAGSFFGLLINALPARPYHAEALACAWFCAMKMRSPIKPCRLQLKRGALQNPCKPRLR